MSRSSLIVVWAGIGMLVISWLFPPWEYINFGLIYPGRFASVFSAPHPVANGICKPDVERLALVDLAIATVMTMLIIHLRSRR